MKRFEVLVLSHAMHKPGSLLREALWVMIQGKAVMLPCKVCPRGESRGCLGYCNIYAD